MAIFRDDPTRTLHHGVRIWIAGIDVTDRLNGAVSCTLCGRGGYNSVSFSLSNANNGFILTDENIRGEWKLGGHPGEYGEQIKHAMYLEKNDALINARDTFTGQRRWPLVAGSTILHALDPVFVAVRWPYTQIVRWIPRFKGYISNKPVDRDWESGKSAISVSCYDIRALMAYMRVQMNYLITNEVTAVSSDGVGRGGSAEQTLNAFDPVIVNGLLSDLQLPTNLSTPLANMSLEETVRMLIVGGIVPKHKVEPGNGKASASIDYLQRLFSYFGGTSVTETQQEPSTGATGVSRRLAGVKSETDDYFDVKAIGRFRSDLGAVRWPREDGTGGDDKKILELWHRLTLFGIENSGNPWTDAQVQSHGSRCTWGGDTAPHAAQLYMLLPPEGSGMATLTEYTFDSGSSSRSWSSRKTIIEDYLEKLDYHWFTSGCGDLVVEFPMYDLDPSQFGKWEDAFTVRHDGEGKNVNVEDDQPEVPTLVQATGSYDPGALSGSSDLFADALLRGDGMSLTNTRVTLYAPVLASRFGVREEPVSFPYVTDICRLRQFAILYFQRKLAEADTLSSTFIFRPLLVPNRPMRITGEMERMGWISSISDNYALQPEHGTPSSAATFKYVRRRDETGQFVLITGSKNLPLSYNGSGPLMNPTRGIQVLESYSPAGNATKPINSSCPDENVQGRPNISSVMQTIQTGEGGLNLVADACESDEMFLTERARELWRQLRATAEESFGFSVALICTYNPGDRHESIDPYLHGSNPSPDFDIIITYSDGSPGVGDDYNKVGELGKTLGLWWGGDTPTTKGTAQLAQEEILARAQYHVARATPYVWGGNGPNDKSAPGYPGVDCAGLVVDCYRAVGILGPKQDYGAGALRDLFPATIDREPVPGELAFYNSGRNPNTSATHVVIIAGAKVGTGYPIISASGPGSAATSVDLAKKKGWKVCLKPTHLYRNDFVGFGAVFDSIAASVGFLNHFSTGEG